ncbi:hypothetical protein, partial [Sphingobacterium multivorum]
MNKIILLIIILCIGLITYKTIQRNTLLAVVDKEENAPSDSFRYTMAIKEVKKRITNNKKRPLQKCLVFILLIFKFLICFLLIFVIFKVWKRQK